MSFIYVVNDDNSARYILGEKGDSPILCIGINPSIATSEKPDMTIKSVRNRVQDNYNGWIMLNIYPQITTKPDSLHKEIDIDIHNENLKYIEQLATQYSKFDIWATWGSSITRRKYLFDCLKDIVSVFNKLEVRWFKADTPSFHPHHPLYLSKQTSLVEFDIKAYLKIKNN